MIKKDNVNCRAFVGDFKPVNVFAKDNKVAGYVSESASGQELELSNTYNDSYDGLKVFGKSEQKAQWNQAEGVTTQAGTPSPASPIDLVSNIPAGSYQISTENGIYEVTLTEDLRGLDDAYRDKICFDSVSGTGYLEQNTQKVNMQDKNISNYSGTDDETLHFGMAYDFDKSKVSNNQFICTHFQFVEGAFYNPTEDSMVICKNTDTANSLFVNIRKEHLDITDFSDLTENVSSFQRWISANSPTVILPLTTPIKTALTFTKVTSSTLPVLPWTAYGNNLFDGIFEYGFYDENGAVASTNYIRSANYIPVQPNTLYYFLNNKDDDTFLWYDGGKNFISQVNDLSAPSPANARYMRFFFYGSDLSTEYMICSGAKPTEFEPFNPTPPESLTPSPDYPQQIYDLSDVTVTSRGRNLFDMESAGPFGSTAGSITAQTGFIFKSGKSYVIRADINTINYSVWIYASNGYIKGADTEHLLIRCDKIGTSTCLYTPTEDIGLCVCISGTPGGGQWDKFRKGIIGFERIQISDGTSIPTIYDKYRCTSATINTELSSIKLDPTSTGYYSYKDDEGNKYLCDYIYKDGDKVYKVQNIKTYVCNGKEEIGYYETQKVKDKDFYVFFYPESKMKTFYEENDVYKSWGYKSMICTSMEVIGIWDLTKSFCCGTGKIPGDFSGNIVIYLPKSEVDSMTGADVRTKGRSYWKSLFDNGFTCTFKFIQEPVTTDITDTDLGQAVLALKTAPYYTKLYADKETGGLEAIYKHF